MSNTNPPAIITADQAAALIKGFGELTGEMRAMHHTFSSSLNAMREDIRRIETASNERSNRLEDSLVKRMDSIGTRVTNLENEDKRMIEKVASLSALGGGVGGALAAGLVELIKRF